jgi:hypothetical protein
VLACPDCGGRLQIVAFIAEATVAGRILDHLGLDSRGPPLARAQAPPPPELNDPGPSYHSSEPIQFCLPGARRTLAGGAGP